MEIWKELFGTYEGQLSLAVIVFTLVMAAYFIRLFIKNTMAESSKNDHL